MSHVHARTAADGLPSIHADAWDPLLAACDETGTVLFAEHVHGCFFDDAFGLKNLDAIGVGNVL